MKYTNFNAIEKITANQRDVIVRNKLLIELFSYKLIRWLNDTEKEINGRENPSTIVLEFVKLEKSV